MDFSEAPKIGLIPSDWQWAFFGDVCKFSQYGVTATSDHDGQYPMLRMNNLQDGKISTDDLVYINLSDKDFEKYRLETDDLLVNRTNSYDLVGKTARFDLQGDYVCASYLVRFRLDDEVVYPRFITSTLIASR